MFEEISFKFRKIIDIELSVFLFWSGNLILMMRKTFSKLWEKIDLSRSLTEHDLYWVANWTDSEDSFGLIFCSYSCWKK